MGERINKCLTCGKIYISNYTLPSCPNCKGSFMNKSTEETNKRIEEIYEGMRDLNVYKNTQYGNIGSEPLNLFARYMSKDTPALNGIYQRLDDKLARVKNCPDEKPRVNDVCDIMGYLSILLVNIGVTKEDIAKFKD